jgi:hypothetical protein
MNSGLRSGFIQSILAGLVILAGLLSIIGTGQNTSLIKTTVCPGTHQYVRTGSLVSLDGRCSDFNDLANDDDYIYFHWKIVSRPANSTADYVTDESSLLAGFVADVDGDYEIELSTGISSSDAYFDSNVNKSTFTVTASTTNARPVAEAGAYQEVAIGDTVQLHGSGTDADDDSLAYSWSFLPDSPIAVLSSGSTASPSFVADQSGDYTLDLVVNDGIVDSLSDAVLIRSRDANMTLPVAVAGADQYITVGSQVDLDGGNSYSAWGKPLTYRWRMISRPYDLFAGTGSEARISDETAAQTSFVADKAGAYMVRLVVNDGANNSSRSLDNVYEDRLVVVAGTNQLPIANGGADHVVNTGAVAIMDGSASSDPEQATLTYSWTLIKQPAASTAALSSLDTESTQLTPDRDGDYLVRLLVNDGTNDSAPDIVRVSASSFSGGASLALLTSLPYAPPAPELPTWIQIDTDGSDSVRVVSTDATPANFATAMEVTFASATEANFSNYPDWTIISPASLTIDDGSAPTLILQRTADAMYYKLVLDFTVLGNFTVQIDALQSWRCGTNPSDCP